MRRFLRLLSIALLTLLVGCADRPGEVDSAGEVPRPTASLPDGSDPTRPTLRDSDAAPATEVPLPSERWTVGSVVESKEVAGVATLAAARIARNEGFDRIVLEFEEEEIPSYHIEYVDRPVRQCGSGETVEIEGDGWLMIGLEPARAHDDEGRATIGERQIDAQLPVLLEMRIVCDFEAQVEWVAGVGTPNPYRVMELAEPARLVIDFRH